MNDKIEIDEREYRDLIKSKIEHEDNLNSSRLSWLAAIQAILLTACLDLDSFEKPAKISIIVIGLATLFSISIYLNLGLKTILILRSLFSKVKEQAPDPIVWIGFENSRSKEYDIKISLFDRILHLSLPIFFLILWIIILIRTVSMG